MDHKKNSLWFDSPFRKGFHPDHALHLKPETQLDRDQSFLLKQIEQSPLHPQHRHTPRNTMSPWSKLLNFHQNKEDQALLHDMLSPQYYEGPIIEEKVVYSDQQNQNEVTPPIKQEEDSDKDHSEALPTTAKKQPHDQTIFEKKTRPVEKGLRKLSQRAFEIVRELKNATYKEVATMLALELNNIELEGENKEEQNIKRRVYDALNVLIALGVLRKDGRKIVSESAPKKRKEFNEIGNEEMNCLREKLQEKQAKMAQKRQRLVETGHKYKSIQSLLLRNKLQKHDKATVVSFPFIGLLLPEEDLQSATQLSTHKFVLRSDHCPHIFGDIDSLKWFRETLGVETKSTRNTSNEKTNPHSQHQNKHA